MSLVKFYKNPYSLSVVPDNQYKIPTKKTLINNAKCIHNRLFVDKVIMMMLFSQSSKFQVVRGEVKVNFGEL